MGHLRKEIRKEGNRNMKTKIMAGLITIVVIALGVTVTIESGGATQPTQAAQGDAAKWLHFSFDSSYTAYNPVESTISITNVAQLERKWGIGCDDPYYSVISRSPAIFNGTLYTRFYTGPAQSKLHAYDARTGQMLWQFSKDNTGWAPQPVVSEDGIIFDMEGSNPTHLYAVDADTGEELWEAPIAFDLGFSDTALVTVDEANDLVYIVESPFMGDGKLYALDKQTGEIVWYKSKATDDVAFEGDYALLSAGKIFVEAEVPVQEPYLRYLDRMLCIDASSQDIEIIFDKPEGIELDDISKYTLCNDKLIVTFCDRDDVFESIGTLVVYNVTSQAVLWQKEYSTAITGRIACNTTRNVIYVPTDPYQYALDATTGEEIWKYKGYGEIYNPSVANGIVYFLSDTNMYAIDEETGERVFRYPLGEKAYETTQVAICDGMVYFSGNGGTCDLYALGLPILPIFDTDSGTYPSIMGTHNGTITPSHDVMVSRMYTYPCAGTGGHSEYVLIYGNGLNVKATWNGYQSAVNYHYIDFSEPFTLEANVTYNYTIKTDSYPQIHHTDRLEIDDGVITCDNFVDANGKICYDWIPAIRLE
jgi:outer membrane protein assembly factor BamB